MPLFLSKHVRLHRTNSLYVLHPSRSMTGVLQHASIQTRTQALTGAHRVYVHYSLRPKATHPNLSFTTRATTASVVMAADM